LVPKLLNRHFNGTARDRATDVVVEDIDATESADTLFDHPIDGYFVNHVGFADGAYSSAFLDRTCGLLCSGDIVIDDENVCAFTRE
jgi:hypothetical protein